ncbi:hypothetical protein GQ55_3G049100 [Panicum hallii var. hallii]|uniref:Uncharacterized protein n=1 Tax=Panicum hallii var. hallii TaxID=1504633 RepID=A0A2T7E5U7_9POAL|nr:hypothetical protein GQ55_3G049100 [Panicum hallii var. hallii]
MLACSVLHPSLRLPAEACSTDLVSSSQRVAVRYNQLDALDPCTASAAAAFVYLRRNMPCPQALHGVLRRRAGILAGSIRSRRARLQLRSEVAYN